MHPTNIAQLCYGIPGVLAYFLVIYAMYGVRRVLNRSFIVIFVITAVINIATWLNTWLNLRLQREPIFFFYYDWLNNHKLIADITEILISQFYYAQNVCLLLLTLDRFAVIFSLTHNTTWWHSYYLPITIIAQMLCVGLNVAARLPIHGIYLYDNETGFYSVYYNKELNYNLPRSSYIQLFFGISIFLVCSLLNVLSLRKLVRLRRKISMNKEISFFLISFCIFLAQVLNIFVVVLLSIVNIFDPGLEGPLRYMFYLIGDVMYFTSDLFSIGPGYYTLLLPSPIRRLVYKKLKTLINDIKYS